ncbi:MAG: membrane dipeptidase [Bacteroidia bacterium]|nr:membrane dipeptidase [Bacteroidia bacterium]
MGDRYISILVLLIISSCGTSEEQLARRADKIHQSILTVDTHCDTPMDFRDPEFDMGVRHDDGCVDFPRMKEGGLHSEFFAVFTGQGPRNDSAFKKVHNDALFILNAIHKNVEKNSSVAEIALTAEDAYRIRENGKIAAFIGVENGYPIGLDLMKVKEFYDLGARYITLCHTRNNDICDSSNDPAGPESNGLSDFGRQVVREMNSLGMMVDVSHISDKSFYDVLAVSKAPVIASHSSSRALCCNPRNLSDDMLLALKQNGGVIQICILSAYLRTMEPNPEMETKLNELRAKYGDYDTISSEVRKSQMREEFRGIRKKYEKLATVSDIVDHIDHVVQVIGIDYVGIGTDFDGGGGVEGCKSAAEVKNITIELLRRGYSKKDIKKIWSGNIMRVLRQVEKAAEKA